MTTITSITFASLMAASAAAQVASSPGGFHAGCIRRGRGERDSIFG